MQEILKAQAIAGGVACGGVLWWPRMIPQVHPLRHSAVQCSKALNSAVTFDPLPPFLTYIEKPPLDDLYERDD